MSRPPIPWRAREFVDTTFEVRDANGCMLDRAHLTEINKVFKEHAAQEERIPQLTKERDNAREVLRLSREMRNSAAGILIVQKEIMKRALGDDEYDVVMKRIVYSSDWVDTFLEEVERMDNNV